MEKNQLVMELMELDDKIKEGQEVLAYNISLAGEIIEELQSAHGVTLGLKSVAPTQPVAPAAPVEIAAPSTSQGPELSDVEQGDGIIGSTPIPPSSGDNPAVGRINVDVELNDAEWELEVAKRGAPVDTRPTEAIRKEARQPVAEAAQDTQSFETRTVSNLQKAIDAGWKVSAKLPPGEAQTI